MRLSKEFAQLRAVSELNTYFSTEHQVLDQKCAQGPSADVDARIAQVNQLAQTLNAFFASMTGSEGSALFSMYEREPKTAVSTADISMGITPRLESSESSLGMTDQDYEARAANVQSVAAKSQQEADAMLREYQQSTPLDTADQTPSEDPPISVLDKVDASEPQAASEQSEANPALNATAYTRQIDENLAINDDPTQIASVQTAVERQGDASFQPVTLSEFTEPSLHDKPAQPLNLIGDDLARIRQGETLTVEQGAREEAGRLDAMTE